MTTRKPLIHPDKLLKSIVSEMVNSSMALEILVPPVHEQEEYARARWKETSDKLVVAHTSP